MKQQSLQGRRVVVTGAGSGIGRATALAAVARGAEVFTCDVSADGLEETSALAQGPGRIVVARLVDVAKADDVRAFAEAVHAVVPAADLLVNNAGVPLGASFADTTLEDWRWIVDINFMGVVHGCHFFVPKMIERGRGGHIANLASLAAFLPIEGSMAYCATKSAVLAFSEGLRVELARHDIGVTAVCPGVIDTPLVRAGRKRGLVAHDAVQAKMEQAFSARSFKPDVVAHEILGTLDGGPAVLPVAVEAWAFYYLKRFAPRVTLALSEWSGRKMREATERLVKRR